MNQNNEIKKSKGIPNCGNSCFMNSVFQMLYSINNFRDKILDYNKKSKNIEEIKKIFTLLNKNNKIKQKNIIISYEKLYKLFTNENLYKQQDAAEFLMKILILFEKEENIKKIFTFNIIRNSFCLKIKTNKKIQEEEKTDKNFNILLLDIKENSIQKNIEFFEKPEQVNLSRCSKSETSYITNLIEIPENNNYLIINLKRYNNNRTFNNKFIEINHNIEINENKYFLIGTIFKSGSANSGHYVYCTYKNGKINFTYNDNKVYDHEHSSMELNKNAYILLYKKITINHLLKKKQNQKQKIDKNIDEKINKLDANLKNRKNISKNEINLLKK